MKRIKCPKCRGKYKILSAGNTDHAQYIVAKSKRKGGGKRLKKITRGSQYQMILRCFCRDSNRKKKIFSIVGRSKAHAIMRLRIWRGLLLELKEKSHG